MLNKIFDLNYIKSLSASGTFSGLILIQEARNNYKTWKDNWNKNEIWNDGNSFIPFYLLPDYKSGADSFVDTQGILHEGRLKELFKIIFGIDVEPLT